MGGGFGDPRGGAPRLRAQSSPALATDTTEGCSGCAHKPGYLGATDPPTAHVLAPAKTTHCLLLSLSLLRCLELITAVHQPLAQALQYGESVAVSLHEAGEPSSTIVCHYRRIQPCKSEPLFLLHNASQILFDAKRLS